MWILATVLLLISVGGVLCDDEECRKTEGMKCDAFPLTGEFPQTPEKYAEDCRNVVTFSECFSDVLDKCGDESENGQQMRRIIFYVQRRMCNPESHIYEAFSTNLGCIETTVPQLQAVCELKNVQDPRQKKLASALEDYLLESLDEGQSEERGMSCMETLFNAACITVILGEECGTTVGDAYLDMANNVNFALSICPENVVNDLPFLVNTLRAIDHVEHEVENAIRKRK